MFWHWNHASISKSVGEEVPKYNNNKKNHENNFVIASANTLKLTQNPTRLKKD